MTDLIVHEGFRAKRSSSTGEGPRPAVAPHASPSPDEGSSQDAVARLGEYLSRPGRELESPLTRLTIRIHNLRGIEHRDPASGFGADCLFCRRFAAEALLMGAVSGNDLDFRELLAASAAGADATPLSPLRSVRPHTGAPASAFDDERDYLEEALCILGVHQMAHGGLRFRATDQHLAALAAHYEYLMAQQTAHYESLLAAKLAVES